VIVTQLKVAEAEHNFTLSPDLIVPFALLAGASRAFVLAVTVFARIGLCPQSSQFLKTNGFDIAVVELSIANHHSSVAVTAR